MNTIIALEDYYAVFLKHGKTMKIGEDFQVLYLTGRQKQETSC